MRLLFVAALGSGACTVSDAPDEGVTTQSVSTHNRLATNRLATNRIATNRLATNRLATNSLSAVALPDTSDILSTSEGRDVYSYVISCALPENVNIQADIPGAADTSPPDTNYSCLNGHCTFYGALGLTPNWLDRRLDRRGKAWISACLYARCNLYDTAEAISLRGRNPGLAVGVDEGQIYTVEEGAFYGNLFNDVSEPIDWNACRGEGQASGEFGGLVLRDCTEEDPANPGYTLCGFKYAGDCRDFTPEFPSPYACRVYESDGTYEDCYSTPGIGTWPGQRKNREVITSYVSP